MYKIVTIVGVIAAFGGAIWYADHSQKGQVYIRDTQTKEVKVDVPVDALDTQVKNAIAASSTEIAAKAQAAYDAAKHQAEVEVELSVTADYKTKIEEREQKLKKESVAY